MLHLVTFLTAKNSDHGTGGEGTGANGGNPALLQRVQMTTGAASPSLVTTSDAELVTC
jgi:hypothetical protein